MEHLFYQYFFIMHSGSIWKYVSWKGEPLPVLKLKLPWFFHEKIPVK